MKNDERRTMNVFEENPEENPSVAESRRFLARLRFGATLWAGVALVAAIGCSTAPMIASNAAPGAAPGAAPSLTTNVAPTVAADSGDSGDIVELIILHTNDCHGGHRPVRAPHTPVDAPPRLGGAAALATFVQGWRDRAGDSYVLLLDAGDIYQGTPEGSETKGKLSVALMNLLRYDAMAIGNHEFDHGVANLKGLIADATFPMMAENLRDARTGARPREVPPPVLFERGGIKIGVASVTTEELAKVALLNPRDGWTAERELPDATRGAAILRDSGADLILLLTHIGVDHDSALIAGFGDWYRAHPVNGNPTPPGVALVVGGHSHTRLDRPLVVAGVPIVQTGANGKTVGEVRLRWDRRNRRVVGLDYRVVDLMLDTYPEDARVTEFLKPWLVDIDRRMNVVIGRALIPVTRGGRGAASSLMGNLQSDIIHEAIRTDIVFHNKGGMRADIAAGPVRLRDLYTVSPFGNTIVTMRMTGAQVRAVLEKSLSGGITGIEFSGLKAWFDASRPPGDQVVRVEVNGRPLEPERLYTIATNSFLGYGGDGYTEFRGARDWLDTGKIWLDAEVAYWRAHRRRGVTPPRESRWVRAAAVGAGAQGTGR